jgi:hypothetical protein
MTESTGCSKTLHHGKDKTQITKRETLSKNAEPKVRLNLILRGENAKILMELKSRGIVSSYSDCIGQSIRLFYDKITKQDLLSLRLKALQRSFERDNV